MPRRVLRPPCFGLRHKCIAAGKSPLDPGVFCTRLGVCEIKPLRAHQIVRQGHAHTLTFGRRHLRQHGRPDRLRRAIVTDHLEPRLALHRAGIDQLVINTPKLSAPIHRDPLSLARVDRHAGVKERCAHHALDRGLPGDGDLQVANLLTIEHPGRNGHGLGLTRQQHVLTRPCPRHGPQHKHCHAPPTT